MRADADGLPVVGREFSMLGVRVAGPRPDIRVLDDGTIMPEAGGMSAFIDPRKMPKSLRPRTLPEKPGESPFPCFSIEDVKLPSALAFRKDKDYHGLVEPRVPCRFEDYEAQLGATRVEWKVAYGAPE
jgi:hypothetical protein